ncbi:MAG: UvrD-helicase domain-containing protein [Caldimicrobium sp.]|nr:UvrD-helicase domain-containing protein [Caldimicrobium sp.]MCX7873680.1 UvrD-helicase domain-containing protein [Caldimicrobium sp.]MDW8095093.1 UvrD-helicase domain-containing protein [Caldimicrobium sp.]
MENSIIIYQASAGSGKTFQISLAYLSLLKENITKEIPFKDILAITFTNKAVYEMKERIIKFLKEIAHQSEVGTRLSQETTLTPEEAQMLLNKIFLYYDFLEIRTIDSFLLKLFRGLAYEMNLYPKFSVVHYVDEDYLEKALLLLYEEALVNKDIREFIEKFVDFIIDQESKVQIHFKNRILRELMEVIKVSTYREEFLRALDTLREKEVEDEPVTLKKARFSLELWLKLKEKLEKILSEEGKLYMGIWKEKLAQTLSQEHLPWIYMKLGRLVGFIIDEFQDTDRLQWLTIYPLLENMISEGKAFISAGDPKQSIYRWKGGDPALITTMLEKLKPYGAVEKSLNVNYRSCINIVNFNNAFFEILKEGDLQRTLMKRVLFGKSEKDIDYNLLEIAKEEFAKLFSKVTQNSSRDIDGKVYIDWLVCKKETEQDGAKELIRYRIKDILGELRESGELNDTAILQFKNDDITELSGFLLDHGFPVLGSSFLKIRESPVLRSLLAFIKFLYYPEDELALAALICGLYGERGREILSKYKSFKIIEEGAFNFISYLQTYESDIWDELEKLLIKGSCLNLYQLLRMLVTYYKLEELYPEERPYVYKLFNIALKYTSQGMDGEEFLKNWESHAEEELELPEEDNLIRILTIHLSKGLEFKNVILPLDFSPKPYKPPLGLVFTTEGVHRGKKEDLSAEVLRFYYLERISHSLEIFNLLYVAFTRAKKNLFLIVPIGLKRNFTSAEIFIKTFEEVKRRYQNSWPFLQERILTHYSGG